MMGNRLKRYALAALAALTAVPGVVSAQIDRTVVVTKEYQPTVGEALKLPTLPEISDISVESPSIEYEITPMMYPVDLTTRDFRPATISYWELNRPSNFYIKLGAGYPVNTVADLYASMYDSRKGYAMAYANHHGQFGKMKNFFGISRDALQARTRAGVAGGLYCGRHLLEGDASYNDVMGYRYARRQSGKDLMAEYEEANIKLRFGDDFSDLSRINFNVGLSGGYFHDKSDWIMAAGDAKNNLQQFDVAVNARAAREFGRHYAEVSAGYQGNWGIKTLSSYGENIVNAGVRYGYNWDLLELKVGADYYYDRISTRSRASHYVIPYAHLTFNIVQSNSVIPFVELDGSLRSNGYKSLASMNQYVEYMDSELSLPSTVNYDLRFGASGRVLRGRLGYKLYADMSFVENALYWYSYDYMWLRVRSERMNLFSLNLEIDYRPIESLTASLGIKGRLVTDFADFSDVSLASGVSPVEGFVKLQYSHRKFTAGVYAVMSGPVKWSSLEHPDGDRDAAAVWRRISVPFYVDAGVNFEWHIKDNCSVFIEGSNLANMKIYHFAHYREQGIRCTAGVKLTF